jgi:uncharacterized repeat protein (TIGR01451 family)
VKALKRLSCSCLLVLLFLTMSSFGSVLFGATTELKLLAGDGAPNDHFGYSVAIDGDTAIIGAAQDDNPALDSGSAWVFIRDGSAWVPQQKLTAPDGVVGDRFGVSVDISGDTAIVGASSKRVNGHSLQGKVYVYTRSGAVWTPQQQLTASDGAEDDQFGCAVAISGGTAVIGAAGDNIGGNPGQGSAYIFMRNGIVWTQKAKLVDSAGGEDVYFGSAVDVSGNTAIVGGRGITVGANMEQGAADIFVYNGTDWLLQSKLTALDGAETDSFGFSVAIDQDLAMVGAYNDDVAGVNDQGSAYIFSRSGTVWSQQAHLVADDGAENDHLGVAVAIDGDLAIAGAQYVVEVEWDLKPGAVYAFVYNTGAWTQQSKITPSDNDVGDRFGFSVALSGHTAVAGACFDDIDTNPEQGSAYIFSGINDKSDLSLTKTAPSQVRIGQDFTYTLTVSNDGPSTASNVLVTDLLPDEVIFGSSTPGQGSYNSATGLWTVGNLASGETATLHIRVKVKKTHDSVITNTAKAEADQDDPFESNNSASQNSRIVISVGGEVMGVSQSSILALWLSLSFVLVVAVIFLLIRKHRVS